MAAIDGEKLRRYNDMYFNVQGIVSNMSDDDVHQAVHGSKTGNPTRGKLIEKMMQPYTPSFLLPEVQEVMKSKPIEGLEPRVAEGIMQAIENRIVTHQQWLAMSPIWKRIHATARQLDA